MNIFDQPMIDWPSSDKPERDVRMVHCVINGYTDCPARVPSACICNQMPRQTYEDAYKIKYGEDLEF